jgi:tellurite resistance protein
MKWLKRLLFGKDQAQWKQRLEDMAKNQAELEQATNDLLRAMRDERERRTREVEDR